MVRDGYEHESLWLRKTYRMLIAPVHFSEESWPKDRVFGQGFDQNGNTVFREGKAALLGVSTFFITTHSSSCSRLYDFQCLCQDMNVEKMEQDIGDHASQAETPQKSNKARRPKQRKVQRKPNKSKGNNKGNGEPTQTPEGMSRLTRLLHPPSSLTVSPLQGPADFTPPQHQPRIFESEGNPRNATSTEKQSSAPKTAAVLKVAGPCPSAKMKKTHKKKAKQGKAQQKPQASPNTREDPEETLSQPAGSTSQDKGRHEVSRAEDRSKEDGAPAHEDANSQQATTGPDDDTAADLSKALQGVRFAEDQDPSGIQVGRLEVQLEVEIVDDNPQTPSPGGSSANVPAFKFDSMDPRLLCRRPHCRRMTSCWGKRSQRLTANIRLTLMRPRLSCCYLFCVWTGKLRTILSQKTPLRRYPTSLVG